MAVYNPTTQVFSSGGSPLDAASLNDAFMRSRAGNYNLTSSLFIAVAFIGTGATANMITNINATRDGSATPAVVSQITVNSNSGLASAGLAFTVGQSVSFLGGPNSGNGYALNPIAQGYAGPGGYQVSVGEANLNNIGTNALVMDAATAAYGWTATGGGIDVSTAGFRAYGLATPAGFNYGFAASGNIVGAAFFDNSSPGASSSFVGQSGMMVGSTSKARQSLAHAYVSGGNTLQILGRFENDTAGTGVAAIGLSTSYSGSETRSAKGGLGLARAFSNGRGPVSIFNRLANDGLDFTAADAMMNFGVTAGFSGQTLQFNMYQSTAATLATQAEGVAHFGIVSSLGGANPIIYYKNAITFDATANSGSGYIWGENGVVNLTASLAHPTTGASGTGSVATVLISGGVTIPVGQSIKVYGVTPAGYNGIASVIGSGPGTVSYVSTGTGAQTVAGVVAEYIGALGSEIDVNVANCGYDSNGGPYAGGYYVTGTAANASTYGTAAYIAAYGGPNTLFNFAALYVDYGSSRLAKTATISDQTRSPIVLHSNTAHATGIDFSTASFSGGSALVSANNTNISFLDSGATPRVAVALDGSNILQIGATAINSISFNAPIRLPSFTTAQKNALTPSAGWKVFDTSLGKECIFNGSVWQTVTST